MMGGKGERQKTNTRMERDEKYDRIRKETKNLGDQQVRSQTMGKDIIEEKMSQKWKTNKNNRRRIEKV